MSAQAHQLEPVPAEYRHLVPNHGKSPWHPSAKATNRVLNVLPVPTIHECGRPIEIAHHTQVYGREYSDWPWMYRCRNCDALVGMHPFTNIPLGTLADAVLRKTRQACKQPFELLWTTKRMTRDEAYAGLATHLGIAFETCHFGWFDAEMCERARDWAVGQLRGERS